MTMSLLLQKFRQIQSKKLALEEIKKLDLFVKEEPHEISVPERAFKYYRAQTELSVVCKNKGHG